MNEARVRSLAHDYVRDIHEHWRAYGEPVWVEILQGRYGGRVRRVLGLEWTVSRWTEYLSTTGLLHVIRGRRLKTWIFLGDVWRGLSDAERDAWRVELDARRPEPRMPKTRTP